MTPQKTHDVIGRGAPALWLQGLVVTLTVVTLAWCYVHHRWTPAEWRTPIIYSGDALQWLSSAKAQANGEIYPILPKNPGSLGAPFVANWNDYPTPEEGPLAWLGLLARIFNLFAAANIAVLSANLLAATSFLFVCWRLQYNPILSTAGAILFGLSRYALVRGLSHFPLTFYWHLPLGLLVIFWCLRQSIQPGSKKFWFGIAVAALFGTHNPYYSGMFLQFLAGTALFHLIRRSPWRQVALPLVFGAVLLGTFALVNFDTFYTRYTQGHNPDAVIRGYASLEVFALKPIELLLPLEHRLKFIQNWARQGYFTRTSFLGEPGSAYVGLAGIAALLWLLWLVLKHITTGERGTIPLHLWAVLWVCAYSVVGGFNGFIGTFGLMFFRGSNRYSIVILTILLLFLVRQLSAVGRGWSPLFTRIFATAITIIGILDQLPAATRKYQIVALQKTINQDVDLVSRLESRLPIGAMLFQLPIMDFPEVPPVGGLADYELFRPYLSSHHLRFSYGSNKGRPRERWQRDALQLGTVGFVERLEQYGFAALSIAKAAYADKGSGFVAELRSLGRSEIIAESPEFVCVALHPSNRPVLPSEFAIERSFDTYRMTNLPETESD